MASRKEARETVVDLLERNGIVESVEALCWVLLRLDGQSPRLARLQADIKDAIADFVGDDGEQHEREWVPHWAKIGRLRDRWKVQGDLIRLACARVQAVETKETTAGTRILFSTYEDYVRVRTLAKQLQRQIEHAEDEG